MPFRSGENKGVLEVKEYLVILNKCVKYFTETLRHLVRMCANGNF